MFLKNKLVQICIALLMMFGFSGCGAKGAKFSGFETPKQDESILYVYREKGFGGSAVTYDVKVTTQNPTQTIIIGTMKNGGFLKTNLKANEEVEVWAKTEAKSSVTIETKPNETYCVKASIGIGFLVGRPHLKQVDKQTCQKEIVETNHSE
ncbi:hypothetical protein A3835_00670 [Campylobacter concisus]|uniref:Lipoprotein n=1 Tax=Campylobacter concisus TaxID=199 RepID=A0A1X0U526_9BACT|nr:hypothetical protein A3835_00670 [Campylobacter concisus]